MSILETVFPFSFSKKKTVIALIINIVIYLVAAAVIGWVLSLLGGLPLVGTIVGWLGWIIGLYVFVGIVLSVLDYLRLI